MKAFPTRGWNGHEETISEGMDLRDYFAGQIIQGLLAHFVQRIVSNSRCHDASKRTTYI